ncbi:MAG: sugar transferase [Actinobacteria bacterium]|nr:MAG: sugar transferase [Actinomycetota bacterium]
MKLQDGQQPVSGSSANAGEAAHPPSGGTGPSKPRLMQLASSVRRRGGALILLTVDVLTMSLLLVGNGWWSVLFVVLVVTLFGQALLYRSRFTLSILDDLPRLGMRYLAAAALTFLAAFLFGVPWRDVTPVLLLVLFVLLVVERSLVYVLIRRLRRQRVFGKNTLIVGTRDLSRRLAGQMVADRSLGLRPIGYVDRPPSEVRDELNLPVLGPVSDLAEVIERYRPDIVIVGYAFESLPDQVEFMRDADRLSSTMLVVPRLYEVTPVRSTDEVISDVPMTRLRRGPFRSPMWKLKRVVDMLVSGIAILLLSPLLAILALVDRIVDGPGVIFRQERVGLDGRTIEVMKFRSLRPASEEESATNWNIKHDDRVSWYGKFLRRSSLDELPQLFNIWRGDMSLVGPRPERPHFVREFAQLYPFYGSRHRVPCGLTGWAQVNGLRGDTSIKERARYDNFYIENWSVWLDIKIMLRTITTLTKGSG